MGDDLGGRVAVVPHTAEVACVAGRQDLELHLAAPVLVLAPAVVIARRLGGTPGDSHGELISHPQHLVTVMVS